MGPLGKNLISNRGALVPDDYFSYLIGGPNIGNDIRKKGYLSICWIEDWSIRVLLSLPRPIKNICLDSLSCLKCWQRSLSI